MPATIKRHGAYLAVWALLMVVFWVAINFTDLKDATFGGLGDLTHPFYFGVLYATSLIIPVVLFNIGVMRNFGGFASYIGRSIGLLSIGASLWGIGNLIWFYYNGCTSFPEALRCSAAIADNVPYPSWADAGYLALLPFAGLSLYYLTKVLALRGGDLVRLLWIPVVIFAITGWATLPEVFRLDLPSGLGGTFVYGHSTLFAPDYSFAAKAISSMYVVTDVVLMSLGVMLLWHSRRAAGGIFFAPVLAVAAGMVSQYVGDLFFFQRVADETFYNGDVSDGLYAISMYLMTLSAFLFARAHHQMSVGLEQPSPSGEVAA